MTHSLLPPLPQIVTSGVLLLNKYSIINYPLHNIIMLTQQLINHNHYVPAFCYKSKSRKSWFEIKMCAPIIPTSLFLQLIMINT